jgi:CRP-like cAMP-binding protein
MRDNLTNLLNYIHALTDFPAASWELLQPALTTLEFKKGDYLLKEGTVCNALFYIDKGYCRSFYLKDGLEKNIAFFFEDDIATNINSFGSGTKSGYAIIAAEKLTAVAFDKQKLFEASRLAPEIETLGRKCIRRFATRQEEHATLFKLYTAQERYEWLEKHQPQMLQRISLTQLSSYLGIARETLSRIRKRRT